MKMAKKVLSVVLSIAMALSCFAIAASAYGPDDADYQAKIWLTASTGKTPNAQGKYWTSKTALAKFTDNEECKTGEIEANPGDIVWIRVYQSGNYYPLSWQTQLFYSNGLETLREAFDIDRPSDSWTANNLKKIRVFNEENDWLLNFEAPGSYSTVMYNAWFNISSTNQADVKKFWPTADNDINTSLLDMSKYEFDLMSFAVCADMEGMDNTLLDDIDPDNAWIIKIPYIVPNDAKPGTTYTVTIPEGTFRRNEKPFGQTWLTQMGIPEGEDPSPYFDADTIDAPIDMTGNINFDFSDATITIKVPGASLDYKDLNTAIADFEALTETDWTAASWADAKDAYDAAVALVDNAETQDEIDDATDALNDAITALVEAGPVLDFDALDVALAKLPDEFEGYTTSSVNAVINAADAARDAYNATTQDDIDAAAEALEIALASLEEKADMSDLEEAISSADSADKSAWAQESKDALEAAVAAGNTLLAAADETSVDAQATVDAATNAILDILSNPTYDGADYSYVTRYVDQAASLNESDYTQASWANLQNAIRAVVYNLDARYQDEVTNYANDIYLALEELKEVAYTASLELYVAQANAADEADYATDVWAAIQDKVATANTYIGAGLARDDVQDDIDALVMELINLLNTKLADADYTAVYAALEKIPADIESGLYTEDSVAILEAACMAVDTSLKEDKQDEVDAMAQAIEDALDGLRYKAANLGALATALAKAQDVDPELVSEDSYLALDLAMAAAGNLMGSEVDIRDQADIDAAVAALNDAYDALVWLGADYTALDAAIARFDDLDEDLYTAASLLAAKTTYDAAKAVARDLGKADQDTIDTAANALDAAIEGLEYLPGDYSRIDALQAKVDAIGTANEWRYDESLDQLKAILADLDKNLTKKDQATIDAAADAGEAIELKYSAYDYTDYNTAINEFRALNPDDYTTESYQAALAAISGINWNLTNSVDDYKAGGKYLATLKKALKVGTGGLVEVGPADYTAVDAAIAEADELNESEYTEESWAALETAIAGVVRGVNANYQDEVDRMAADINTALNGLKKKVVIDYTALENVYNYLKGTDLTNCVVGKDAFETALANAADMLEAKNAETQSQVNALATAISTAFANLKFGADYSVLEDLIANAENLNEDDWTAESWAAVVEAVIAAEDVPAGLTTDDQSIIDEAADALSLALENLQKYVAPVVPADYDALNATIGEAALKNEAVYTEASWAAFAAALAQAKAVDKNLTADDQAIIDNLEKALADAMAALEVKPAVVGGSVTNVEWEPSKDHRNTFTVTVQARASFVQFIEYDHNNGTRSKSRYSDGVTIVSYDKDGNVVDDRSIALAYEVWTIEDQYLAGPSMGARIKLGNKWETSMDDCYKFTYNVVESEIALVKAELSKTSGEMTKVPATIVVGPDVEYIQIVNDATGDTNTKSVSKGTVLEDGNVQFKFNCYPTHEGDCTFTIRVLCRDKWTTVGTLTYTVGSSVEKILLPEDFGL